MTAAERRKAKQDAWRDTGMCVVCGGEVSVGISQTTGGSYQTCDTCRKKRVEYDRRHAEGSESDLPGFDYATTTTGFHYRVKATGAIGKIKPCPCDDPVILEFQDEVLDFFRMKDIEITDAAVTVVSRVRGSKGRRVNTVNRPTIHKFHKVRFFLMGQDKPVKRSFIESELGFSCIRHLIHSPSHPDQWTLESAKIVKRTRGFRNWCFWGLTDLGRTDGESMIESVWQDQKGDRLGGQSE